MEQLRPPETPGLVELFKQLGGFVLDRLADHIKIDMTDFRLDEKEPEE